MTDDRPDRSPLPPWLFALLGTCLVLYTDDYVIAGILPELAADLGVSEPTAGQLITVFSLTIAAAAPIAAVALARTPRRRLFSCGLAVFIVANAAATLVPDYPTMLALRVIAALAAASVTPSVFAFAAEHAPPERTGRFIAVVSLGVTGSVALGVPVGTWIGGQLGWRATFGAMAVAGALALIAVLLTLPRAEPDREVPVLREQVRTLRRAPITLGLGANCVLMTGSMMMLTYLAPFLADTTTASVGQRAITFSLSGIAGIAGIWLGGLAVDRWGADRTLATGIGGIVASMLGLWLLWLARPAPFAAVVAVGTVWGGLAFFNSPAIQARLFTLAGPVAPQALALNTSGTYLGVASGGAVGGALLATTGAGALPLVSAALCAVALAMLGAAASLTPTSDTL
ncbi:MFS transporter [Tsukamurella sp. 1534]|uniref:MFS transporter n=1 Tax=Tsukamurella sp. 1534 TaxID=1151061 RepID=UPI0003131B75|nr:MFS transporter [Tsukamurella sp. 1534]